MIRPDECAERESADTEDERLEKKKKRETVITRRSQSSSEHLSSGQRASAGDSSALLSKKCSNHVKHARDEHCLLIRFFNVSHER